MQCISVKMASIKKRGKYFYVRAVSFEDVTPRPTPLYLYPTSERSECNVFSLNIASIKEGGKYFRALVISFGDVITTLYCSRLSL